MALHVNVQAAVDATDTGWIVQVEPATEDDAWGLLFPDPFELVFPDGSAFVVDVRPSPIVNVYHVVEVDPPLTPSGFGYGAE